MDVVFTPEDDGTAVTLTHTGWERLSATRPDLRDRNESAWSRVLPHFGERMHGDGREGWMVTETGDGERDRRRPVGAEDAERRLGAAGPPGRDRAIRRRWW